MVPTLRTVACAAAARFIRPVGAGGPGTTRLRSRGSAVGWAGRADRRLLGCVRGHRAGLGARRHPESFVLDLTVLTGGVSISLLVGVLLSSRIEAMSSSNGL